MRCSEQETAIRTTQHAAIDAPRVSPTRLGSAAVAKRYDAPHACAGLLGDRRGAPGDTNACLADALGCGDRALCNTLAGLGGTLRDPCADRRGALHDALHRSGLRLRRQRSCTGEQLGCQERQ